MFRKILIIFLVLLLIGAFGYAYWYFMLRATTPVPVNPTPGTSANTGFQPLNTSSSTPSGTSGGTVLSPSGTTTNTVAAGKIPVLRMLSGSPVGGYSASTTASSTLVRWVDRGRGNIYEATNDSLQVRTLSNTVVPKIFSAVWNRNLTNFIGSWYDSASLTPSSVYAELNRTNPTASSSIASYELRGTAIRSTVIGYAASPDRTRLLVVINEDGNAVGYTTTFTGSTMVRVFSTPMTQIDVAWPSESVIAVTTKGSASYSGFLYFVNPRTGSFTKILGPVSGLSARVSNDGRNVIYSETGARNSISTYIYSISRATSTDAVIKTLADKCVWGRTDTTRVYCGVPAPLPAGLYPDDWNIGTLSTTDKIWQIDATTSELRLVSSLPDIADRPIDAYRLDIDPRDRYLYFMNKTDLSLWSLELTAR